MPSCLLVIDVQNGFVNKHTKHILKAIEKAQYNYDFVVISQFHNLPGSFYRTLIGWDEVQRDSNDFLLAFKPKPGALIVEKTIYSCVSPKLMKFFSANKIDRVSVGGICTDICVLKSAVDLFEQGIVPQVLSKLCASTAGNSQHLAALKTLKRFIGAKQVK